MFLNNYISSVYMLIEPAQLFIYLEATVMPEPNCRPGCHTIYMDIPEEQPEIWCTMSAYMPERLNLYLSAFIIRSFTVLHRCPNTN